MTDICKILKSISRPRLLAQAAKIGAANYRRTHKLNRLIDQETTPGPSQVIFILLCLEQEMETRRVAKDGSYSSPAHLDILIALIGESRDFWKTRSKEQFKSDYLSNMADLNSINLQASQV
ncbi:MAG: DUF6477 family protein [Mangrovicoccus sp.]